MRNNSLSITSILIVCMCLLSACGSESKPYVNIYGQIITKVDTRDNRIHIKGIIPSSLAMGKGYEWRIEDNIMYIKVILISYKYGNFKEIDFEQDLPNNIEKVFIEDAKNNILIWEKSQGYHVFDIQDKWEEELKKLELIKSIS